VPRRRQIRSWLSEGFSRPRPRPDLATLPRPVLLTTLAMSVPAPGGKELSQQLPRLGSAYPCLDFDTVIQTRVAHEIAQGTDEARLRICRSEDQSVQPRQHHRPRAHGARFQRDPHGATAEPPVAEPLGGLPKGEDLCMSGGVSKALTLVPGRSEHLASTSHHRPDRHVAPRNAAPGLFQRQRHHPMIDLVHGRVNCARRRVRRIPVCLAPQPRGKIRISKRDKEALMATIWGLSKKQANYRPAVRPEVHCSACKYMFPPLAVGGCRLVRGLIRGSATCDQFVPRQPGPASS
jgi:hypothetical protein